jgi:hypothetical protein
MAPSPRPQGCERDSPLPPYSAVRRTLHLLGAGAAQYAEQLDNIRKQSTRAPPAAPFWRKLPAAPPATLRTLAKTFNVPLEPYSRYLRETYREWQQKNECSCTEACSCGRFATTITHLSAFFVDQAEVSDPNLDPEYKRLFPGHKVARGYSTPFEPAQQISEPSPNQPNHPSSFSTPERPYQTGGATSERPQAAQTNSRKSLSQNDSVRRLRKSSDDRLPALVELACAPGSCESA